jgi:hypothetical protein
MTVSTRVRVRKTDYRHRALPSVMPQQQWQGRRCRQNARSEVGADGQVLVRGGSPLLLRQAEIIAASSAWGTEESIAAVQAKISSGRPSKGPRAHPFRALLLLQESPRERRGPTLEKLADDPWRGQATPVLVKRGGWGVRSEEEKGRNSRSIGGLGGEETAPRGNGAGSSSPFGYRRQA